MPDKRLIVLFGVLLGLRFLGVEVGVGYEGRGGRGRV